MTLDDMLDDRKAQTGAAERTAAAGVDTIETLSDPRDMLRRDALAFVGDRKSDHRPFGLRSNGDGSSWLAIAQGVGQQIVEQLKNLSAICGDGGQIGRDGSDQA